MIRSHNLAVVAAILSLTTQPVLAHQGGQANAGYVGDARGHLVTDGAGKCVKTSAWTRELALAECDPDLVPKKAAQPAPPPAPEPKPAPVVQPAPKPEPVLERVSLSAGALFDVGKADLKPQGKKELDAVVDKINSEKVGVGQITVTGHTDSTGAKASNQTLSERRAESVKAYLVGKGLNSERIVTKGMGDSQPVASNKTAAGRAQNRRVDIDIQGERTGTSAK